MSGVCQQPAVGSPGFLKLFLLVASTFLCLLVRMHPCEQTDYVVKAANISEINKG